MSSKRSRKVWKLLVSIGLGTILLLAVITRAFTRNKVNPVNRLILWRSDYRDLAPYIIAQARFETAEPLPFTSVVYRLNNNMFGMKGATKRPQLGTPGTVASDGGRYQHYASDSESLRDLFLYFDYWKFPRSVGSAKEYVRELKSRGYFTSDESNYLKGIERWSK